MTQNDVGPIDYLAVEFPDAKLDGVALGALLDLVDAGIIRVLDLKVAKVELDGTISAVAITDLDGDGELDLAVFDGIQSGLLDDDDLREGAALVAPGSAVGVLLYENTWAGPFVTALNNAGAQLIASGRIPVNDVIDALDALESE
ncbi:MAG: DUF6325 family protein [Brevundimonas sp.]